MDVWENRSEEERFAAQVFYRSAQQETMEQLRNGQPQSFYRKNRKGITKTGAYPRGFYRMDSVKDLR